MMTQSRGAWCGVLFRSLLLVAGALFFAVDLAEVTAT